MFWLGDSWICQQRHLTECLKRELRWRKMVLTYLQITYFFGCRPMYSFCLCILLKQPFWGISQLLQHSVVRLLLLSFIHNDGCYKVALLTLFTELTITVTTSTALDCNCNCNWFTSHVSFMGSTSWSVRSLSNCQFLNFTLTSEPAQFA